MEERLKNLELLIEGLKTTVESNRNSSAHSIDQLRDEFVEVVHANRKTQDTTNALLRGITVRMTKLMYVLSVFLIVALFSGVLFVMSIVAMFYFQDSAIRLEVDEVGVGEESSET